MDTPMTNFQTVSLELHQEISQFLYREARMLDNELIRQWLTDVVDPQIRYQMVMTEERFRSDKGPAAAREVMAYDDDMMALELRVRHFETGLQSMMDPPQKICRLIANIEAYQGESEQEYRVFSYGHASRFRRLYERETLVYAREDVLRRSDDGALRLLSRRIALPERVVRSKNLLFFL